MKCNIKKINEFFDSDHDKYIKKFIIKLLEMRDDDNNDVINYLLVGLNFYEIEDSDKKKYDVYGSWCDLDEKIIMNFPVIIKLHKNLRKIILKQILKYIENSGSDIDIPEDNLLSDLNIFVYYADWVKNQRKYKLLELNDYGKE